ncbi:pyridoxine 5'-phosphate synthase [Pseudenhygromyxa sp. WMMC2535]|uniref:pyridoxine 5'-phosphate synthase n=1 Tax=Pseudenhygromyxa sp. WMMC2535 TaxID=2712867 RepID=UPI001551FF37|nr:pyridoxine 5'-phosphate synthase [Pseudenhygromyxa sp. WMMC2535]NVB41874.1 pyridoxine 5'-phosphate synthase [Pseudenhygromyxa sp. WMMC2535]
MVRLSVNVNKVATLRNARGGAVPSLVDACRVCVEAGAPGITIHPREDERHITAADIGVVHEFLAPYRDRVEFNIEGDPRPALMDRVVELCPDQCTLVPVRPGEITSEAGWRPQQDRDRLVPVIERLAAAGIRVSLFVEAEVAAIEWAAALGADRVELYTEPYARAWAQGEAEGRRSFEVYAAAAERAHALGLGINAGHDLDLDNLRLFASLPHLDEVSIGHALMSRALFVGLETVVHEYLALLQES